MCRWRIPLQQTDVATEGDPQRTVPVGRAAGGGAWAAGRRPARRVPSTVIWPFGTAFPLECAVAATIEISGQIQFVRPPASL